MLVISRRPKEKIVFPAIDTCIQVLGLRQGQVRLGIKAPPDLVVLREELQAPAPQGEEAPAAEQEGESAEGRHWQPTAADSPTVSRLREVRHALRNRLNEAGLSVALLRLHLHNGRLDDAEETLSRIEEEFRALRNDLETSVPESTTQATVSLPS
jgi:carbon storage regulator CsrA